MQVADQAYRLCQRGDRRKWRRWLPGWRDLPNGPLPALHWRRIPHTANKSASVHSTGVLPVLPLRLDGSFCRLVFA